ncbi:MAG: hypothetical protein HKN68_10910 [Saprospiraceae bacterium]|nr:hypothetical protein [Saprospiraceae bacterium]
MRWSQPEGQSLIDQLSNEHMTFMGGIELKATDSQSFGGLSSIMVNKEGTVLTAISDYSMRKNIPLNQRSKVFNIKLAYNEDGSLKRAEVKGVTSIVDHTGIRLQGELESIARMGDKLYGSLDNGRNRADTIWMLKEQENGNLKLADPLFISDFPTEYNREGIEAMTEMGDGNLWLIHERLPEKTEGSIRYSWNINPITGVVTNHTYHSHLEEVKGACMLEGGGYIVLEKTYYRNNGINRIALFNVNNDDLESDIIKGKLLIDVESKYLDNFEGLTSFKKDDTNYLLVISDNNGDWNLDQNGKTRQKTLLLLFKVTQSKN